MNINLSYDANLQQQSSGNSIMPSVNPVHNTQTNPLGSASCQTQSSNNGSNGVSGLNVNSSMTSANAVSASNGVPPQAVSTPPIVQSQQQQQTQPTQNVNSQNPSQNTAQSINVSGVGTVSALTTVGVAAGMSSSSTSIQATSSSKSSNQDLASLFECPVCFDYVLPPILQCHAGHLVCSSCRPKLTCCPTCRGQLGGNIRNLAMEKVASTVMFPCRYQSSGCSGSLLHTEKLDHEEVCEFRPYSCPCPGTSCKWQGALEQVMCHLMQVHKSITTLQGEDIVFLATDINLPGAVDWVMMQSCFGCNFMLVLEKQEKFDGHQQFFAIVQLIGTRKQAENFAYRLELNGHRRRLTWEAAPRSIHEGVSSAIQNSDCLVFDTSIAQLFSDSGNLGINVTISLC